MTGKGYVTQPVPGAACSWIYEKPAHGNGPKTQLLTIGGIAIVGQWRGEIGEFFLAWAPLLRRDKTKEREILAELAAKRKPRTPRVEEDFMKGAGR